MDCWINYKTILNILVSPIFGAFLLTVKFTEYICKMQFTDIIDANNGQPPFRPIMQKDSFPISEGLSQYLKKNGRDIELPLLYNDLINYSYANALKDKTGKWTYWENAVYPTNQLQWINAGLIKTYQLIKKFNAANLSTEFKIESIDFCEFGNSTPFRVKILNLNNGEIDFFYIKLADASRVYGLELEQLLSSNTINFLCHKNTLVEEHIEGMAGDDFLQKNKPFNEADEKMIAREFIRFCQSCFVRLLGDMRCYNFVINSISNNSSPQYFIRAIDFDQQCYEGRVSFYLPQLYKENEQYVEMVLKHLGNDEIAQLQKIELEDIANRITNISARLIELFESMGKDELSENHKIRLLRGELNEHFKTLNFASCSTMGAILKEQLRQLLQMDFNSFE